MKRNDSLLHSLFSSVFSRRGHVDSLRRRLGLFHSSTLRLFDSDGGERRSAFTLIELLVVVAILAVLLGLLTGGIRKSMDNAKKKNRATEVKALQSAIMTYWADTGKPPISIGSGVYVYPYAGPGVAKIKYNNREYSVKGPNNEVFEVLLNPSKNPLKKRYLDMNQLRTGETGHIQPVEKASDPIVDYTGAQYKVIIDLQTKTATVE